MAKVKAARPGRQDRRQPKTAAGQTGDGRVQVAYLHGDHGDRVSHSWHESMMRMVFYDLTNDERMVGTNGPFMVRCDAGGLVEARNLCVTRFLDETPHEWLWFVDTDMGFAADTVDRLLAAADPVVRPVVGALCFGMRLIRDDGMGGSRVMPVPTLFSMARNLSGQAGFGTRWHFPEDTLVPVAATGAACLLVHRSVMEKVRANEGDRWFEQKRYEDGRLLAEDLSFCYRVGVAGFPIFVHTGVKTTHHKHLWIGADDYTPPMEFSPLAGPPELSVHIEVPASLATLSANQHVGPDGMLKLPADLDRYRAVIEATKPEIVVETGTCTGASARWFADLGLDVITIDLNEVLIGREYSDRITQVVGDSSDPAVAARVAELVAGRRAMVSLDSDHSAAHVIEEIVAYGPLVAPGCYLVVEDGIFGHAPAALRAQHGLADMIGSPLDAIAGLLLGDPDWSRDVAIERTHPTSHSPAGWWIRNG